MGGWRRVVAAGLLVPSLNGELQRPPTEPQAKGLYLPCLSVLPCYRVPCIWIPFLDPRPDGLAPVWTGKPALDYQPPTSLSSICTAGIQALSLPLSAWGSAQPLSNHQTCSARCSWAQSRARFSGLWL